MDISTTLAASAYSRARQATAPEPLADAATLKDLAKDFTSVLNKGEQTAQAAMLGKADPHALVQALSATELAVETAVTLRDKVVEAYQEILRMPV